ncbi:hypothetical protein AKJ37_01000 [candidate division MSBL1 archaeon SCGC-AAA259I09]|uniref:Uncharacterized protein n=2 Tax=candidate division MSBL1 TaxID=215777 RepID=A0A133UTK2_9EURY|nr:hypothetical protein AKJ38_00845 [candidate division MSBL1 archaeon SCGC-AAA259I14]KXA98197.1 hypothetical protein AKJ37_01000 [candidate division MSBL1 archaeon SCGC-AAA259I09]
MPVVDNNVLSALAKIERLDLLNSFFGKVLTTSEIITFLFLKQRDKKGELRCLKAYLNLQQSFLRT